MNVFIRNRLSFGIIAATILLVLSLIEAVLVLLPYGYSWIISVSTLMLIGWVIEIMILRETILATQMELFSNRERWQEVKDFYIAKAELQHFIAELEEGGLSQTLPAAKEEQLIFDDFHGVCFKIRLRYEENMDSFGTNRKRLILF